MIVKSLRLIYLRNRGKKEGQIISLEIYICIKGKKMLSTKAISVWAMLSLNGHPCFDRTLVSLSRILAAYWCFLPLYLQCMSQGILKNRPQTKKFLRK